MGPRLKFSSHLHSKMEGRSTCPSDTYIRTLRSLSRRTSIALLFPRATARQLEVPHEPWEAMADSLTNVSCMLPSARQQLCGSLAYLIPCKTVVMLNIEKECPVSLLFVRGKAQPLVEHSFCCFACAW